MSHDEIKEELDRRERERRRHDRKNGVCDYFPTPRRPHADDSLENYATDSSSRSDFGSSVDRNMEALEEAGRNLVSAQPQITNRPSQRALKTW
eukprot:2710580-Amphidinium_carterae.1